MFQRLRISRGRGRAQCLALVLGIAILSYLTIGTPSSLFTIRQSSQHVPTSTTTAPAWHDTSAIARAARPLEDGVFPTRLQHLEELRVNKNFSSVWISSAFLDSRPLVVGADPEVTILGVGGEAFVWESQLAPALACYIVAKQAYAEPIRIVSTAHVQNLPNHPDRAGLRTLATVMFTCPFPHSRFPSTDM